MRTRGAWTILLSWILLPVPDGPVMSVGFVFLDSKLIIEEYRIVSIV